MQTRGGGQGGAVGRWEARTPARGIIPHDGRVGVLAATFRCWALPAEQVAAWSLSTRAARHGCAMRGSCLLGVRLPLKPTKRPCCRGGGVRQNRPRRPSPLPPTPPTNAVLHVPSPAAADRPSSRGRRGGPTDPFRWPPHRPTPPDPPPPPRRLWHSCVCQPRQTPIRARPRPQPLQARETPPCLLPPPFDACATTRTSQS